MTFHKTLCVFALTFFAKSLWSAETNAVQTAEVETNGVSAVAEKPADPGFEKYKTIMDRMPFGPEPVNFNPDAPGTAGAGGGGAGGAMDPAAEEAMKTQEEQQILASVRVSALNVTPSGKVAVGFTDSSKQPAGTYYLKVGESRDGWTVKSADAREMKVTLEKNGVEATLALGEGAGGGKDGKAGGSAQTRNRLGNLNRAGLLRPAAPAAAPSAAPPVPGGGSAFANLRARRAQKEAERRAEAERQAAAAAQAKADQEREAADRERAAAEREQQREALLQIQEELRRQREAKEQQRNEEAAAQNADSAQNTEAVE